jgi:hypothetical protein
MGSALRRVLLFLLGAAMGYCAGFKDARTNDEMVFVRAVRRVQGFAERTVGEHEREVEEAAKSVTEEKGQ